MNLQAPTSDVQVAQNESSPIFNGETFASNFDINSSVSVLQRIAQIRIDIPTIAESREPQLFLATVVGESSPANIRSTPSTLMRAANSLRQFATSVDSLIEPTAYAETKSGVRS